ncbi:unnamed protein product [Prorocentrum cordatum]|uniref:Uncharacterized protein n=1 Tax=Prorocentrum cordatum TaxID=2364126 RepID=A0ABN9S2C4_9DINO|nr:unnamed protein product [Polarella glacialis]
MAPLGPQIARDVLRAFLFCDARMSGNWWATNPRIGRRPSVRTDPRSPRPWGGERAGLAQALRRRAFEDFDEVIFRCFGVHGREFGSSVNGFQMTVSGLEFSSGPPFTPSPDSRGRSSCSRRPASAATERSRCPRRTRLGVPGAGVQEPRARRLRRCGPQAGRHSTGESGLCVVELVETARVPIVKCRWCAEAGGAAASQAPGSPREFEVDVSFCNEAG